MVALLALIACNPSKNLEPDDVLPSAGVRATTEGSTLAGTRPIVTRPSKPSEPQRRISQTPPAVAGALKIENCYPSQSDRIGVGGYGSGGGQPKLRGRPPASRPAYRPKLEKRAMADGAAAEPEMARAPRKESMAESQASAVPAPPPSKSVAFGADDEAPAADLGRRMERKPSFDLGGKVYLSNDDSMSLASAQRLLWAVDHGRSFSPSEVRPHELLNYFTFDTAPVPEGEVFSLMGAAERNGDQLSVALTVAGAVPPREPLDLTLVIDRSGSMRAEGRMEYVKRGLQTMTEQLREGDRVDLVLFDTSVCTAVQDFVVGRDDNAVLTDAIRQIEPRGSTDLDAGLRTGYRIQTQREAKNRNQRVLLLTDAQLNSGNVNESLVSEIGARFEEDGIRVTGIGVGRNFNDRMLNKITEKGKGAYVYLGSEAVVDRVFGSGFESLVQTVAHDVQFSIQLPKSLAMKRFYGEESSTNAEDVQPIHYYAGTSQVFLQDLAIQDGAFRRADPITFTATYEDVRTGRPEKATFSTTIGELLDADARNLNKAQALMKWTDVLVQRAMNGRNGCEGVADYHRAALDVKDDAELAYVSKLTGRMCGVELGDRPISEGVAFKVKIDSDQTIPEVRLTCNGTSWANKLSGSDTVVRFDEARAGRCELRLEGRVPMLASVNVPASGGSVRCLVRGGRMSCD